MKLMKLFAAFFAAVFLGSLAMPLDARAASMSQGAKLAQSAAPWAGSGLVEQVRRHRRQVCSTRWVRQCRTTCTRRCVARTAAGRCVRWATRPTTRYWAPRRVCYWR